MRLSHILRRFAKEKKHPLAYKWAERAAELEAKSPSRDAWLAERKRFLLELEAEKRRIARGASEVQTERGVLFAERARLTALEKRLTTEKLELEQRAAMLNVHEDAPAAVVPRVAPGKLPSARYTPYLTVKAKQGLDRIHRSSRT